MDPTKRMTDYAKAAVDDALVAAEAETDVKREAFMTSMRTPRIAKARQCFFWHCLTMMNEYRKLHGLTIMELSPNMVADRAGYERTTLLHGAARWAEENGLTNPSNYNLSAKRAADARYAAKQGGNNV